MGPAPEVLDLVNSVMSMTWLLILLMKMVAWIILLGLMAVGTSVTGTRKMMLRDALSMETLAKGGLWEQRMRIVATAEMDRSSPSSRDGVGSFVCHYVK